MTQSFDPESDIPFAREYRSMSEVELLDLAASYDSLMERAQAALRAEFARRKMDPPLLEGETADVDPADNTLVTVRTFRDLSEGIVARSVLESAGLFCLLRDENMVRMEWQISNFLGGLRLQVRAVDEAAATELLNQPMPTSIPVEGEMDYQQPACPRCGSSDISFERTDRNAALISLYVLSLPMPLGSGSWRCHVCGSRWVDDADDYAKQSNAGN